MFCTKTDDDDVEWKNYYPNIPRLEDITSEEDSDVSEDSTDEFEVKESIVAYK